MADETTFSGPAADDQTKRDPDLDLGNSTRSSEHEERIGALEVEKERLVRENEECNKRIEVLLGEIDGLKKERGEMMEKFDEMRREVDQAEQEKKAFKVIAARAAELETEIFRLQHDLGSSMSESEEAVAEVGKMKQLLEEFKRRCEEKESRIENLEKEKASLQEWMDQEVREKEKLKEEKEIRISELESEVAKGIADLVKVRMEKNETDAQKSALEENARQSEERIKEMEEKVKRLLNQFEESEKLMTELKEKKGGETINGVAATQRSSVNDVEKGSDGLKVQWPAVIVSTGTVAAAAAIVYLNYSKKK